jgi:hypothetical protein
MPVTGNAERRPFARRWFVTLLAAFTLVLAGGTVDVASARPLVTGVNAPGEWDPLAFQKVRQAGARMAGIPVYWSEVAPVQEPSSWQPGDPADPNYNWVRVDAAVSDAVNGGLTPLLVVESAPTWAQRCQSPPELGEAVCDPDPGALADFAKAAATRFSGSFGGLPRVRFWQGLNEPNLSLFFGPQYEGGRPIAAGLYRKLINAFYAAIKSVNRSNLVLAAGLGPIGVPRFTLGPLRFARELLCMRGRRHPRPAPGGCEGGVRFDVFDIHPYTTGGPTHRGGADDVELGDLGKLQTLLKAADRAGRIKGRFRHTPLWITELAWDSRPPDPGGLPMRILARWTAEALYRAWRAGVGHLFWWQLRDPLHEPELPYSQTVDSGLYLRGATAADYPPKRSMYAFRFPFVAFSRKSGFFFWGRTPTSTGGKVVLQIQKGGKWRNATVAKADGNGIFTGVVEGAYGRHEHGTVRARYRGESAIPFSLHPVKDFYQPPFGRETAGGR